MYASRMFECAKTVEGANARIFITGTWNDKLIFGLIDEIGLYCQEQQVSHVLVDMGKTTAPTTNLVRHKIGEYMAEKFGSRLKIAILIRADQIIGVLEDTAVNRGARVLVTGSENKAVEWLAASRISA